MVWTHSVWGCEGAWSLGERARTSDFRGSGAPEPPSYRQILPQEKRGVDCAYPLPKRLGESWRGSTPPLPQGKPGPQQGSPVSGSPGSRLISMSKWHCGRSCAPIATEVAARARRKGEESGKVWGQGEGGAEPEPRSPRASLSRQRGRVRRGPLPPRAHRLPYCTRTQAGELFTWLASSLSSSPCKEEKAPPHRPEPNADNEPPHPLPRARPPGATLNPARVTAHTARTQSPRGSLTERKRTWACLRAPAKPPIWRSYNWAGPLLSRPFPLHPGSQLPNLGGLDAPALSTLSRPPLSRAASFRASPDIARLRCWQLRASCVN